MHILIILNIINDVTVGVGYINEEGCIILLYLKMIFYLIKKRIIRKTEKVSSVHAAGNA